MMRRRWPLALLATSIYAFLHLPVLILMGFSFNESRFTVWTRFSWRWYRELARNPRILDRKSTRLNSSHIQKSRMPSSA